MSPAYKFNDLIKKWNDKFLKSAPPSKSYIAFCPMYMSCNGKMTSLSHELRELVSLRISRESSAIDRVTVLKSIIGVR